MGCQEWPQVKMFCFTPKLSKHWLPWGCWCPKGLLLEDVPLVLRLFRILLFSFFQCSSYTSAVGQRLQTSETKLLMQLLLAKWNGKMFLRAPSWRSLGKERIPLELSVNHSAAGLLKYTAVLIPCAAFPDRFIVSASLLRWGHKGRPHVSEAVQLVKLTGTPGVFLLRKVGELRWHWQEKR